MEKAIRKATDQIKGHPLSDPPDISELTKCTLEIAEIAFTAYRDDLRVKALKIASAIAEFEDALDDLK